MTANLPTSLNEKDEEALDVSIAHFLSALHRPPTFNQYSYEITVPTYKCYKVQVGFLLKYEFVRNEFHRRLEASANHRHG